MNRDNMRVKKKRKAAGEISATLKVLKNKTDKQFSNPQVKWRSSHAAQQQ